MGLSTARLTPFSASAKNSCQSRPHVRSRQHSLRVRALGSEELKAGIEPGTKVTVTKSVKVFHAPKKPELDLQGMEGTVLEIISEYKGKKLSANLPYKTQFELEAEDGGKPKKLLAHLVRADAQPGAGCCVPKCRSA